MGRITEDAALLRLGGTQQIADHHDPGREPHAHVQRRAGGGLQRRRSLDDGEPRPHGLLSVMLVRLRIAEIGEDPVAHIFGHETTEAAHRLGDASLIGGDDLTHVLGIEPG